MLQIYEFHTQQTVQSLKSRKILHNWQSFQFQPFPPTKAIITEKSVRQITTLYKTQELSFSSCFGKIFTRVGSIEPVFYFLCRSHAVPSGSIYRPYYTQS